MDIAEFFNWWDRIIKRTVFSAAFVFIPSLLFGSLFGCYLLSLRYFARDYRLLLLNWTNINQLFNRGSGSLGLVATMMGSLIISIILIVLYGMLALFYPFWLVNIPVIGLVLILSALWIVYYQRTFWKNLNKEEGPWQKSCRSPFLQIEVFKSQFLSIKSILCKNVRSYFYKTF